MTEFLSVLTDPAEQETEEDALDTLIEAVREFAEKVGVQNVRVTAHNVPFTAFEGALSISVLHHSSPEYSANRSWLSGHHKIRGFNFDMHSVDLPKAAVADLPGEDESDA